MITSLLLALLQAAPAQPVPAPRPTEAPPELVIDVAKLGPESTVTVSAPRGTFKVRLENAAPSAVYRTTVDVGGTRPSVKQKDVKLSPAMLEGLLRVLPVREPECEALERQGHDLLTSTEETQVPTKVAALEKALADQVCPKFESMVRHQISQTRPLVDWVTLDRDSPDAPVKITLERVDPATGAVQKKWLVATGQKSEPLPGRQANEEEWLVADISERVAALAAPGPARPTAAVARAAASPDGVPRYTVSVPVKPAVSVTVALDDHAWSPRAYEPLARAVLGASKPAAGSARPEGSALAALLDLRVSTIQKENQRVSAWLGRSRLDPAAHEQAALVVGALALREAAGDFWDARPLLNRMAAHLAVAQALRGGAAPSIDGQIAGAILASGAGREKDALDRLARIKPETPSSPAAAWVRALTLRNTRDWRTLPEPAKATLLERLEYYRAVDESVGSSAALALLDESRPEAISDWAHIALASGVGVEESHRFAPSALDLEVAEVKEVWRSFRKRELAPSELVGALNETAPGPEVLDWATWAAFFQRHVANLIESVDDSFTTLGLPDESVEFRKQATASFGALHLYPITAFRWSLQPRGRQQAEGTTEARLRGCGQLAALVREAPERVTPMSWDLMDRMCRANAGESERIPRYDAWFSSAFPHGTVLDPEHRMRNAVFVRAMNQPGFMEQLLALAPRRYLIVVASVGHRYRPKPKPEELKAAYGPLLEYDGRALGKLAELVKDQPEEYRQVLVRLCDLNADNCLGLAEHLLLDREMGEAAAVAFERARQHARNRVGVANESEWFVHYYIDLGQVEKARAIAEEAEGVGSAMGMAIMGRLHERMGKYPEAEASYRQIAERYQDTGELDNFYMRREVRAKDGRYRALAADALKRVFPEGLQRVSLSDFTAPPDNTAQGLPIAERDLTEKWKRYGMKAGDRVFALDGYRVGDWDQYLAVRSFSDDPQMSTIVWRDGRYLEVKGTFKRRRFGP